MICKNCQQEMPEVGEFCPFCGAAKEPAEEIVLQETAEETVEEVAEETAEVIAEETAEASEATEETAEELVEGENEEEPQQPKAKLKLWQLIAIIAGGVVLLAVLAGAVLYAMGIDLKPRENDLYFRDSYTAEDEAIEKAADTVVATLGDKELTVSQLQLYYTNDIYSFLSQYGSYLGYILDVSMPLEDQTYPMAETEQTWQQYFLQTALTSWQSYALVDMLIQEDGYVLPAELQEQMDGMAAEIDALATSYGYASAQEYLDEMMTPGISLEAYMEFNRSYYTASAYLDDCFVKFTPSAEEIQAYYEENLETFNNNGIMPDIGLQSAVRHILIMPQGGTTDDTGSTVYSDEEKAAAYAEAERILEEWKSGAATEESFAELANTYSADGGSNTTGGLYEGVNVDANYVEEFKSWAADANRKEGDTEIVETQFGYHIMYFVSGEDYFTSQVSQQLITQRVQEMLLEAQLKYPMEVNYKKILLYTPDFGY